MSVPASKRSTSQMEFISTATSLAARVARFSHSIPKRYTFQIANPIFEHAYDVVFNCRAANDTYVNSQATFDQRRCYLNEAVSHLNHIETLLDICLELATQTNGTNGAGKLGNVNTYSEIVELIAKEKKLISGCKRRDTQAYSSKVKSE